MTTLAGAFNASDKSAPGHYSPSQTSLLLLDFHSLFIQKATSAPSALSVAAQMRTWAQSQGIQVIHCLVDINSMPFPTCKDANRLTGLLAAMKSSGGDKEPAELLLKHGGDGDGDDVTFTRRPGYVSALKSPGLDEFLREKGIKSLVLTGLSTSSCVLRTASAACDAEYVVSVISDGCADQVEQVHDMMVGTVLKQRGYVMSAAEFREGFEEAIGGGK